MQNLDLWLQYIDTREIIPLFERNAREYIIPKLTDVDWSVEPEYLVQIARHKCFSAFKDLESEKQYSHVFDWLLERNEKELLLQSFRYLLAQLKDGESDSSKALMMLQTMLDLLKKAPFLSATFARIDSWTTLPPELHELFKTSSRKILHAHILSANVMQDFVVVPFKRVMSQIQFMTLADFADMVELISLAVRSSDIALDLLLECLGPESTRLLPGHPLLVQHFVRNLMGIALDHIDEATQPHNSKKDLLDLKVRSGNSEGYQVVESRLRIDAPTGTVALTDHVRLTTASSPANSVVAQTYTIDAVVESSEPGLVTFRCLHPLPPFVEQCSWELQNCGSFVTTKTMFDAVRSLATRRHECCSISEQILGMEKDTPNHGNPLPVGYTVQGNLNTSQNAAVEASLSYPLTCLWGPPGTGKTHTIVEIIKQLQESQDNRRILVTAPTHNAVDNVMRKYLADVMAGRRLDAVEPVAIRVSTDVSPISPYRRLLF
jgi:hypothetical protein